MLEIRFHGRGGQGAVTSAELLANAALIDGKYFQAFPSFGPERRGAPVTSFCRISDFPIHLRTSIYSPDIVIVLDPSLLNAVNVTDGLKEDGILIINSQKWPEHFAHNQKIDTIVTVDATAIALQVLGQPITNTILLGALIRAAAPVKLSSITAALKKRFDQRNADLNTQAMQKAYHETKVLHLHDCTTEEKNLFGEAFAAVELGKPSQPELQSQWTDLEPGLVINSPGNSKTYFTGSWRSFYPLLTKERCIKCGICWILCPDAAYTQDQEGFYPVDLNYCKGCGICAQECPTGAITMLQEKEEEV